MSLGFLKTDHNVTYTEIYFLPVCESYAHVLSRDTKHLTTDTQVFFHRQVLPTLLNNKDSFQSLCDP